MHQGYQVYLQCLQGFQGHQYEGMNEFLTVELEVGQVEVVNISGRGEQITEESHPKMLAKHDREAYSIPACRG